MYVCVHLSIHMVGDFCSAAVCIAGIISFFLCIFLSLSLSLSLWASGVGVGSVGNFGRGSASEIKLLSHSAPGTFLSLHDSLHSSLTKLFILPVSGAVESMLVAT